MHAEIQLAIVGAATGALYALLGAGLVVIYRSSNVLNFAQGMLAAVAASIHLWLHQHLGYPVAISAALAIAAAAGVGGLFQFVVVRPLRRAPPLGKVVATLGFLLLGSALIRPIFGDRDPAPTPLFDYGTLRLPFGDPRFVLPWNRVCIVLAAVLLILGLWTAYRFTNFGRATRAAADNRRATELLGLSSQKLDSINWIIGAGVAGLAGVLLSSNVAPTPLCYADTVMAAIAVALIGGFQSYSKMLIAALLIGAAQSVLLLRGPDLEDITKLSGWSQALPLLVIVFAVVVLGKSVADKGTFDRQLLPRADPPKRLAYSVTIALTLGLAWYAIIPQSLTDPSNATLISGLLAMSLVVVTGYGGQVSLAQMSIAGFGAFWAAKCATDLGLPFPLPVLLGGLIAVPLGLLIGSTSLRVRGLSLAVVTLGAGLVMDAMFFSNREITGADLGYRMKPAKLGPIDLNGLSHPRAFGIALLLIVVIVGTGVAVLRRGPLGVSFLAVRANERGAAASGMSVATIKLTAFALASFIAGLAGSLQGYRSIQLSWESFAFFTSIILVAYAYLGGITTISGAIVAGSLMPGGLFSYIFHFQGNASRLMDVLAGVGVIQILLLHPEGIAHVPWQIREARARKHERRNSGLCGDETPNCDARIIEPVMQRSATLAP